MGKFFSLKNQKQAFKALAKGKLGTFHKKFNSGAFGYSFNPFFTFANDLHRGFTHHTGIGRKLSQLFGKSKGTGITGYVNSARSTIGNTGFHRYT